MTPAVSLKTNQMTVDEGRQEGGPGVAMGRGEHALGMTINKDRIPIVSEMKETTSQQIKKTAQIRASWADAR